MIIIYFFLCLIPVWLIYRFTTNYSVLMGCRKFLKYAIIVCIIIAILQLFLGLIPLNVSDLSDKNKAVLAILFLASLLLSVLLYYIWIYLYGIKFYDSTHIDNLDFFVLYLRSFRDDRRKRKEEHRLIRSLYKRYYCPFAIGRPNEIKAPTGSALRLYVGEDWKERVQEMMQKAPLILLRVNNTKNFFWEFEQCVINQYLGKSVFWVSNVKSYSYFFAKARAIYGIEFPDPEKVSDNCVIFKIGEEFSVTHLDTKESYKQFVAKYDDLHHLTVDALNYFSGRGENLLKQFFTWKRDPLMMEGIQKWSWTAFLFPEFYVLFQRFPYRGWVYLSMIVLFPLTILLRFPIMLFMGRNGRKLVWLSEKWERVDYFEEIHSENNKKIIAFFTLVVVSICGFSLYLFK